MPISFAKVRVLDPSRIARRLLWHVLSIGVVSRDEPEEHAGMAKAGRFLFRVKSGSGMLELPGECYELKRGPAWWLLDLAKSRRYLPPPGTRLVTMGQRFSGPGIDAWRNEAFGERSGFEFSSRQESVQLRKAADELLRLAPAVASGVEWRMHEILGGRLGVLLRARTCSTRSNPKPIRRPAA